MMSQDSETAEAIRAFTRAYRERTAHFVAQTNQMLDAQANFGKATKGFQEYLEDALSTAGLANPKVRVKKITEDK